MSQLTALARNHIERLFPEAQHDEVARLLREDCGEALPPTDRGSYELVERIHCAALKLSDGRIDKLYDAIALAQTDWRDLLVAAGFAEDPDAHKAWKS